MWGQFKETASEVWNVMMELILLIVVGGWVIGSIIPIPFLFF